MPAMMKRRRRGQRHPTLTRGRLGASVPAQPGDINAGWLDKYTVAHFGSGVAIQLFTKGRIGFWGTLALAAGFELAEVYAKQWWPAIFEP